MYPKFQQSLTKLLLYVNIINNERRKIMDYCSECTYLVPDKCKGDSNGLFYCEKRYDYVLGTSEHCSDFCRAYSRKDWEIKEIYNRSDREKNGYDKPNCYITTIVCDALNLNDNCEVLTTIRNFRDNILTKDEKYKRILVEYDILGPLIACSIASSPKKLKISKHLYDNVLLEIYNLIQYKKYNQAIKLYIGMTKGLLIGFGYGNLQIDEETISKSEISLAGHGRQKVIKK